MTKHIPFALVASALWCVAAAGCSSGDYCRDNCEYMDRCNADYAGGLDVDTCIEQCERQLEGVSEDCRDALDDLGDCVTDVGCSQAEAQSECLDESFDVLSECEGELFNTADSCTGSPFPCETLSYDQESCERQGCSFSQACDGYVASCSSSYSQTDCEQQVGCSWAGDACSGTAAECTTLTATQCETQQGCRLDDACTGTPPPCEAFVTEETCEAIDGCHW
ncbi:MAG: hypothetical protein JRI23_23585 [Deltaproteobacteria bacterium]|jgi:hypothetical protein|nr:hypothetical protein [Deltaproteobacteria bacterium]MBW2534973.1 hypothetical protein [Deltaproteobacteria bacterium]